MVNCAHTSFRKGQRVRVFLKDGGFIIGKFVENKSKSVRVGEYAIAKSKIRQIVIFKGE